MNNIVISVVIFGGIAIACFFLFGKSKHAPATTINVGDQAPLFTLPDENGTPRSMAEFKGKKVVLYFYPKDETPGCTQEACGLRDSFDQYKQHDIVVLGVSYDSPESHKHFKEKEKLPFILLSDTKHEVAHLYGTDQHAMGNLYALRTSFLINEQGKIVHIIDNVSPETHAKDVLKMFGF